MRNFILLLMAASFLLVQSCGNKSGEEEHSETVKKEFGWKDNISIADIPDFPVKGMLNGNEVQFQYINFEKWRGSNDNVLNFSLVKPEQGCGYIENFEGFTLINKGAEIKPGEWLKPKFDSDPSSYSSSFRSGGNSSTAGWNCAMKIERIDNKKASGKILIYFNDPAKSWIAGKFDADICNN